MAWRIVRQPDGKLARWSDVVEAFTHAAMDEAQARELCRAELGERYVAEKVRAGVEDDEPWKVGVKGDGLSRWRDCLNMMPLNRSLAEASEILREMGFPDWIPYLEERAKAHERDREWERAQKRGGAQ